MNQLGNVHEEHVVCNLCGADEPIVVFEKGKAQSARIVRCGRCDLMYADPRDGLVDHEDYERYEPKGLLAGVDKDPNHPFRWRYEKESWQVRDFDKSYETLRQIYHNQGTVVEVGSGLGYLLRRFKDDGWDVLGVDPWRELSAATQDIHGVETIPLTLEQAKLPNASADVVIMLHVIEHVPNPVATLSEIYRVLKPGGHAVIETPRYDTFMFRMLGHRERSVKCEGHIYFFTFASLKQTYEKVGFQEVETRAVGRTLSMERFLWNLGTVSGSRSIRDGLPGFAASIGLNKIKFSMNLRDMQRVIILKPI